MCNRQTWGAVSLYLPLLFDAFGWVMIKHPWSLSFQEFYVDYQLEKVKTSEDKNAGRGWKTEEEKYGNDRF